MPASRGGGRSEGGAAGWGEGLGLLLVAQSSRMLAQSAARAGLSVCAIDHFADADTRRHAAVCFAIPPTANGFDATGLLETAARLGPISGLIYGSGLDTCPDVVEKLAQGRELFGNPPDILRLVHAPRRFFPLLDRLAIPYPETCFSPPENLGGWLIKPGCGEGGKGVGFAATKNPPPANAYFQRQIPGDAMSLLFIADGKQVRVIGFNTQWIAGHDPGQPFLFAGAVNRAHLDKAQRASVAEYAGKLAAALGLVGLNSLDFIVENGSCRVLELNPRPSATMALYDDDYSEGLLLAHIAACRGALLESRPGPVRALRIIYAPQAIRIGEGIHWRQGCADIPNPGTLVAAGEPLCSLMVQGQNRCETEALLTTTETEFLRGLFQNRPSDW